MANLEVQIGADNSDLNKKIKEAELNLKELSKIKLEQIKLGLDTKEINGNIASVKKSLSDLKTVSKDTGNAVSGMAPKIANGGNALMQFSRIAQDAPFGIMGIGNNITATTEAFGHLKVQTGSTGAALKAVASSMMGTGGILLAVSLVTTGLTFMAQKGLTVSDVFNKLTGNFDEFGNAIKKASEEGVKSTSAEVFGLKALVSAAQNELLSKKERLIAVEQLQKQYPGYFGNLSKEKIMTADLSAVVNELTKALINRAIAEKLASDSAEIQLGIYKANAELVKQKNKTSALELKLEKDLSDAIKTGTNSLAQLATIRAKGINAINQSKDAENEARQSIISGTKALEQRQNVINQVTASTMKLNETIAKPAKTKKEKKEKISAILELEPIDNEKLLAQYKKELALIEGTFGKAKIEPVKIDIPLQTVINTSFLDAEFVRVYEIMQDFSNSANQLIQGAISDTFSGLGTMIGNSLAGADGGLEDAGKNILGILGNFMTQFGQLMVETGVGLVIAKKMITSGNGYAMIAGGVALIAIGTAFAASSKKAQKSGGDSFGGGGSGGNTGGSYSSPASSFSGGGNGGMGGNGTVVFEIAGTSLIGVLKNTTDRDLRLGGIG